MSRNDVTNFVQRLEAFEDRLKVRIESVSAFESSVYDEDDEVNITVRGEMHPIEGAKIHKDITLQLNVYDAEGRVISTSEDWVNSDDFFGFHTFELSCEVPRGATSRIRLFPRT